MEEKKYVETTNKGVTAALDSLQQESPDYNSIHQVRSQLQNVIELMGPTTPHFCVSSHEEENDESFMSSIISSTVVKVAKTSSNVESTPRDFSLSNLSIEEPIRKDVGVKTNTPEVCCDHYRFHDCPHTAALRYLNQVPTHSCVQGIPKPSIHSVATNTSYREMCGTNCNKSIHDQNMNYKGMIVTHNVSDTKGTSRKKTFFANSDIGKVEVYYFDHGNAAYYRTTDSTPALATEFLAEKTELYTTKFWAEFFGTLYIGFAFFTSFILQLIRFILYSILRPLTVGIIQNFADYFLKPFLAVLFNSIIQPPLILLYNIATSLRDLCDPLAEGLGYFCKSISIPLKACRLFTIKNDHDTVFPKVVKDVSCECNEKDMEANKEA